MLLRDIAFDFSFLGLCAIVSTVSLYWSVGSTKSLVLILSLRYGHCVPHLYIALVIPGHSTSVKRIMSIVRPCDHPSIVVTMLLMHLRVPVSSWFWTLPTMTMVLI